MKKYFYALSSIILLSALLASCAPANSDKKIKIGMVNWIDNISTAYLWKIILEEKGYDTEIIELEKIALWTGISRGDIDVTGQVWLPLTDKPLYDKFKEDVEIGEPWFEGTKMGIAVPAYVKDINSIEDLNSKKGQLNGEIIGIDPGSSLMQLTSKAKKEYGLELELVESSEAAMLTEFKKAYEKKQPIAVTLWNPHWVFADYEIKYLKDSKNVFGAPDKIHSMSRTGFEKDHPEIGKWMSEWEMNDEQLNSLIKEVQEESLTQEPDAYEKGARKWIEKNRELVDSWTDE
ncbi:glycine betaine ABC transporter substrate-binding protein [Metabacillus sp. SLBN-84]